MQAKELKMFFTKDHTDEYYVVANNDIPPGPKNLKAILEMDDRFALAMNMADHFPRARNGTETVLFRIEDAELRAALNRSSPGDSVRTFGPDHNKHLTLIRAIDVKKEPGSEEAVLDDIKQRVQEERLDRRPRWEPIR